MEGENTGTQLDRVRRICASIPGTVEKLSHGEPTFFKPTRLFVMFANSHRVSFDVKLISFDTGAAISRGLPRVQEISWRSALRIHAGSWLR